MKVFSVAGLFAVCLYVSPVAAQIPGGGLPAGSEAWFAQAPTEIKIAGVTVEGVEGQNIASFIVQTSGLQVGQTVTLPLDPSFGEAIRSIFRLGNYSDVKILEEKRDAEGVYLKIHVTSVPRLGEYKFEGVRKSQRNDLKEKAPLLSRTPLRQGDIERTIQVIKDFYRDAGRPLATVEVERIDQPDNTVDLTFHVDRGPIVEVEEIRLAGNEMVDSKKILKKLDTKEDHWWRFWKKSKFDRKKYEEDLQKAVAVLNERGHFDARVVRDSVYLKQEDGKAGMVVEIDLHEGPQYHIRSVDWEGNTVYTDEQLSQSLDITAGDVYNSKKLEQNLYANKQSSDVSSIYMNRGYMTFGVRPTIRIVEGDSLDMSFDISEGDIFEFGNIEIAGNDKTKDHVIRRELYTIPGQTFSRDAIQESIRRLMQLNYFSQESLGKGPGIDVDEQNKVVDLSYSLEETGSDQLQLSGTWGSFGLVLSLGFEFNNFSAQNFFKKGAWRPLPSGDGQRLSLGIQTNGRYYQNYSVGYTEPWFRGKPTPVGFSVSYSRIGQNPFFAITNGALSTATGRVFYEKRLKWPDDKFSYLSGIQYQYTNNDSLYASLPQGVSQEVSLQQAISRNSTDNPLFPSRGSTFRLSLDVAPPVGNFIQYHKWRLQNGWHVPILPKLTLSVTSDFGYVGSLTGEDVRFQRFVVGGSPFDTQGTFNRFFFATDIVYMRGYPSGALGPRVNNEPIGGRILNKFTSELRWMAIQSEQLQAAPYLFMDGANTWNDFKSYNPAELYRSAGVGMRFFLPILGMLELAYGYNFDEFQPTSLSRTNHDGTRQWLFQFTIGQGFNQ
ncbi:MAG: outer membrane protein assembly factor BamA [Rhodothermales bacterium]